MANSMLLKLSSLQFSVLHCLQRASGDPVSVSAMIHELKSNENDITVVLENLEKERKARKVQDSPPVLWCFLPPSKQAQTNSSTKTELSLCASAEFMRNVKLTNHDDIASSSRSGSTSTTLKKHTHKGELSDVLLQQLRSAKPNNVSTLKLISSCGKTKKDVNSVLYSLQAKGLVRKVVNSPPRWIATDCNVVTAATDINCESLQEQMQAVAINQHSPVTSVGVQKNRLQDIATEEVKQSSDHFNPQVKMEAEETESKCAAPLNLTRDEQSNTGLPLPHGTSPKRSTRKKPVSNEPPPLIPVNLLVSLEASQNASNIPSFPHEILSKRQNELRCSGQQTAMDISQRVNSYAETFASTGCSSNQTSNMNQQQRFQQPSITSNFPEHGPNSQLPNYLPVQTSNVRFRAPLGSKQPVNTRQQVPTSQTTSRFPLQSLPRMAFSGYSNQSSSHSSQGRNQNNVAQGLTPRSNMTAFFNGIRNTAFHRVAHSQAHPRNVRPYRPQLDPNPISALVHYATLHRMKLNYEELGHEGPDHTARFISRCKLGTQKFPFVLAVNKKEGKTKAHKLAMDIIQGHVSDRVAQMQFERELQELKSLNSSSVAGGSQQVLSKNPISLLMELCRAKNMPAPTLDAVRDAAKKQYRCACVIGDTRFPSVTARSKQEGKTDAFRVALEKLQHDGEQIIQAAPQAPAPTNEDAVSVLTKMATQRGVIAKLEILRQYGPPHDPRFECCCYFGDQIFPTAVAGSKKEGKKKAFEIALRHLSEQNGVDNSNVTLATGAENSHEKRTMDSSSEIAISSVDRELAMSEINSAIKNLRSISQSAVSTSQQQRLIPSHDALKTLHKQPISAFMEFGQSRGLQPTIVLLKQTGASHCPKFEVRCCFKDRLFPSVYCGSMKEARTQAAEVALKCLMAEGSFSVVKANCQASLPSTNSLAVEQQTNIPTEKAQAIASLVVQKFNELQSQLMQYSMGKVVLGGLVLEQADGQLHLVSLGTGNRCITGDKLTLDGSTVNDCHAEIITRRGFIRFLCVEIGKHLEDTGGSIFYVTENGMLAVKPSIKFHLYISTAPCGDGALFTPNDNEISVGDEIIGGKHRPLFTSNVHGLLRTKVETGEGTIPIPDDVGEQTFDGLIRGDHRLRTMSCSDKICRWNVLGIQGALLSNFLDPIYLESLTLGQLFNAGHLSRALCCRVDELSSDLPGKFRVNHVDLGCTGEDVPRGTAKTKHISINWTYYDGDSVEVLDGNQGKLINGQTLSRVSKKKLFENFKALCETLGQSHLVQENYLRAKQGCANYVQAKEMFYKQFLVRKKGIWVQKPREEQMFS